jgi:hypothetical protein
MPMYIDACIFIHTTWREKKHREKFKQKTKQNGCAKYTQTNI